MNEIYTGDYGPQITVKCAWCKAEIGALIINTDNYHADSVSHGICKACAEEQERKYAQ